MGLRRGETIERKFSAGLDWFAAKRVMNAGYVCDLCGAQLRNWVGFRDVLIHWQMECPSAPVFQEGAR